MEAWPWVSSRSPACLDVLETGTEYRGVCLSVPGKVVSVTQQHDLRMGRVDFGGVARDVCLEHVDAQPGDWVLVHVGFALTKLSSNEAEDLLQLLRQLGQDEEEPA
jgi:hydrogenase expression/formation protein HypC